jgi:hypothetical protein
LRSTEFLEGIVEQREQGSLSQRWPVGHWGETTTNGKSGWFLHDFGRAMDFDAGEVGSAFSGAVKEEDQRPALGFVLVVVRGRNRR